MIRIEDRFYISVVSFVITTIMCIAGYAVFLLVTSVNSKVLALGIVGVGLFSLLWYIVYLAVLARTGELFDDQT